MIFLGVIATVVFAVNALLVNRLINKLDLFNKNLCTINHSLKDILSDIGLVKLNKNLDELNYNQKLLRNQHSGDSL